MVRTLLTVGETVLSFRTMLVVDKAMSRSFCNVSAVTSTVEVFRASLKVSRIWLMFKSRVNDDRTDLVTSGVTSDA